MQICFGCFRRKERKMAQADDEDVYHRPEDEGDYEEDEGEDEDYSRSDYSGSRSYYSDERSNCSDDHSEYEDHHHNGSYQSGEASYERQSTEGGGEDASRSSTNGQYEQAEENGSESYETDTDYNREEDDDDEFEEHDDIQSAMVSLEEKKKDPMREEVEQIRQNFQSRFGDDDADDDGQARQVTATAKHTRGRSPTQYRTPSSSFHSNQSGTWSKSTASNQNVSQTRSRSQDSQKLGEDAVDPIQAPVCDSSYQFNQKQQQLQREPETPSTAPETPTEEIKTSPIANETETMNVSTSSPPAPASPSTQQTTASPTSSKKLNASGHKPLSKRSQHRKTATATAPRISWKADPEESFSDWKVKVMYDNGDEDGFGVDVYHIHRNIVGYGNRKSLYLLRSFRDRIQGVNDMRPGQEGAISTIELSAGRAKVFPMVLDFMYYTKEAKQTLTAERACNVFKLAELLEIPALQKAIADFYAKNLSLTNMGDFLMAAGQAKADRLLVVSKAKIGQMITEKPELSGLVPPKFMADILLISRRQLEEARTKEPEKYTEDLVISQSRYWSKAACICAAHNESVLTPKLFNELTSEESLPHIDLSVAPKLLSMDAKFNQKNGEGVLTSLQRRCIGSITEDFQVFQKGFNTPEECSTILKQLPADVLAEILMGTMKIA
jgi:hypothetical protein